MAPQKFHDWLANLFVSLGFRQMVGNILRISWHDEKDVENVIHIDDGIIAGPPAQMAEIKSILQGTASMKDLGSIDKHGKSISAKSSGGPREVSPSRPTRSFTTDSLRKLAWIRESSHSWKECDETHG